jgi:hypothetical protein
MRDATVRRVFGVLLLGMWISCRDDAPTGSTTSAPVDRVSKTAEIQLDHAIRPNADVAVSFDGKRMRDAAVITNALDAMKAAPETAKKLDEIQTKCKLNLFSIWEDLRFSGKRSIGEGITMIRLSVPASEIEACLRTLFGEVKATDIAGHNALILPGAGEGAAPIYAIAEDKTLVVGTETWVREAMNGAPPDDVKAHALARRDDELGRGVISFSEGDLTEVAFRITGTGSRFQLVAEPSLENEAAAIALAERVEKTWSESTIDKTDLPKPEVKRDGTKVVITAKIEGNAPLQSRYVSSLSALVMSAFQSLGASRRAPAK